MEKISRYAKVTELNGRPRLLEALPLAMQHVVAMIVRWDGSAVQDFR